MASALNSAPIEIQGSQESIFVQGGIPHALKPFWYQIKDCKNKHPQRFLVWCGLTALTEHGKLSNKKEDYTTDSCPIKPNDTITWKYRDAIPIRKEDADALKVAAAIAPTRIPKTSEKCSCIVS